jgi:hypothetical protein
MAVVHLVGRGFLISRPDKSQQISLSREAWHKLASHDKQITNYLCGHAPHEGNECALDLQIIGKSVLKAVLSIYDGAPYLNIRVFVDGQPTRQGVVLGLNHWTSVRTCLGYDTEARIAKDVFTTMLREKLEAMKSTKCEGCDRAYASQVDHECLMDASRFLRKLMAERPALEPGEFCVRLAERCRALSHGMEYGMLNYRLCNEYLRAEIERELLESECN